jgi:hypothetical protein
MDDYHLDTTRRRSDDDRETTAFGGSPMNKKINNINNNNNNNNKTALVGITRQIQRLELANKLRTLVTPMRSSNEGGYANIDLVLVLTHGDAIFQKHKKKKKKNADASSSIFFETDQDIFDFLLREEDAYSNNKNKNNNNNNNNKDHLFRNVSLQWYLPDPNLPVNPKLHLLVPVYYYTYNSEFECTTVPNRLSESYTRLTYPMSSLYGIGICFQKYQR